MINLISIVLIILFVIYSLQIIKFYLGLFKLRPGKNSNPLFVSIIIPARNEANNISQCLNSLLAQNYPQDNIEIIVVNDNSKDETSSIVKQYTTIHNQIKLLNLDDDPAVLSPKKRAISAGIKLSKNELIFTTDADCIAHPDWLKSMVAYFEPDVGMVTGMVAFDKQEEHTLFHKVQSLEFLSLIIAGFGSIGSDMPIIGNGANLAYRRSAFDEVDGFKGIDTLKSGDDDLLIQKVARLTKWKIKCTAENRSFISTKPATSIREFINQRIRWASKGIHYHNPFFVVYLVSVYLFYLLLMISLPVSILSLKTFPLPFIAFILKMICDFLLLFKGLKLAARQDLLKYFFAAELFQVPYILLVGFAGLWGDFNWKDRS